MGNDSKIEDLQAVSGQILDSTERIRRLEEMKRTLDPGSNQFRDISEQIESLAGEMRLVSRAETEVAEDLAGTPGLPSVAQADEEASR